MRGEGAGQEPSPGKGKRFSLGSGGRPSPLGTVWEGGGAGVPVAACRPHRSAHLVKRTRPCCTGLPLTRCQLSRISARCLPDSGIPLSMAGWRGPAPRRPRRGAGTGAARSAGGGAAEQQPPAPRSAPPGLSPGGLRRSHLGLPPALRPPPRWVSAPLRSAQPSPALPNPARGGLPLSSTRGFPDRLNDKEELTPLVFLTGKGEKK